MSTIQIILLVALLIAIAVVGFLLVRKYFKKADTATTAAPTTQQPGAAAPTTQQPATTSCNATDNYGQNLQTNTDITIRQGDTGDEVAAMQRILNYQSPACLTVDGNFGPATAAALQAYMGQSSTTLQDLFDFVNANGQTTQQPTGESTVQPQDLSGGQGWTNWFSCTAASTLLFPGLAGVVC